MSHLLAGTSAGLISTSLLHPLDLVKTRFQAFEGATGRAGSKAYRSSLSALRFILARDGFASLYGGITPALLGSGASWGLYWAFYERAKARHAARLGDAAAERLPAQYHLLSSTEAGVATVLITNPVWLLKTRLQLQSSGAPYRGMGDAALRIVREEGPLALYKGVVPALLLVSHGALQFCAYEEMKILLGRRRAEISTVDYSVMGAASKVLATVVTYPYQVIKTRLQQRQEEPKYTSTIATGRRVIRLEGVRGLYKGLGPQLLRVAPNAAITFCVYEQMVQRL